MEIIIDGVDVSGCPYAEPAYRTPKCIINSYIHCDGINCHYKRMIHTGIEKDLYKKENKLYNILYEKVDYFFYGYVFSVFAILYRQKRI